MKSDDITEALNKVRDEGLARMEVGKSTGGRPPEYWFPVSKDEYQ